MTKAIISNIKRFAVHDGKGIRTTVFFKGCPLKCVWCHNPESIGFKPELSYYQNKCISCGECINVCKNNAHQFAGGKHTFIRDLCTGCGNCETVCLGEALKLHGKEITVDQLLPILLEDVDYYKNTGGGVTLSGGECLCQADFCAELLKILKAEGINTAVDTCGFVPRSTLEKVIDYTDTFLYDIKAIDEDVHIKCTGQSNKIILDNLSYLDSLGKNIEIRIPYVPGFNSDQIEKARDYLQSFKNISEVKILPYHNYAEYKYTALELENTLPKSLPTKEEIEIAQSLFYKGK
ncbi:MAG: glycyl-radical enzyme activating protein [Acutalibacteraceae bacterium]|nr:glycyl-radical enzyme activating protein [Acutalibacteraceae bacterium]